MRNKTLFSTGKSFADYYKIINKKYLQVFDKYYMLHYPFYLKNDESLEQRQHNLSDVCLSIIPDKQDSTVLDVGCGNGVQSIYIEGKLKPQKMMGVDINEDNIKLAQMIDKGQIIFQVDDAQKLSSIENQSVDVLICVESAFHYPDKAAFVAQVHRVLKPQGVFLIADILTKSYKERLIIGRWKRKMFYYHWTRDDYENHFKKTGLKVINRHDITDNVIKGYSGHLRWVKRKQCDSYLQFLIISAFISIQVILNVYLLRRRRNYMIFSGTRS